MVNIINTLTEKNKELLAKIEELENKQKTEISREAQLKIINKIQEWKKENIETGDRLKKYEGNVYPSFISNYEDGVLKCLAGHVNYELMMVEYLHKKENPLDELLEMMLDSITRNVVGYYNWQGQRDEELENNKKLKEKYTKKITRLLEETFPYDKLEGKPSQLSRFGISRCYLDTVNGIDYSDYIINSYKEREEEFDKEIQKLKTELKEDEVLIKELETEMEEVKEGREANLDAIKLQENWEIEKRKKVENELEYTSDLLFKYTNEAAVKTVEVKNLKRELAEERGKLSKSTKELAKEKTEKKELQNELYLANKPLPKLSKKVKFIMLRERTKIRFRQIAEKVKQQSQELVAKIEVRTK